MILPSLTAIENLRELRAAVELYGRANSAICAAHTQARACGLSPQPIVEMVQQDRRAASAAFSAAYASATEGLDDAGAEYLHLAVWSGSSEETQP